MSDYMDDVRLLRRNLNKGFLAPEELQKKLDKLPDVEDRGEWIDAFIERGEGGDASDKDESDA